MDNEEYPPCPKCSYRSGDDYAQCMGRCPKEGSPYVDRNALDLAEYKMRSAGVELSPLDKEKLVFCFIQRTMLDAWLHNLYKQCDAVNNEVENLLFPNGREEEIPF